LIYINSKALSRVEPGTRRRRNSWGQGSRRLANRAVHRGTKHL